MTNDSEYKIARMDLRPGDVLVVRCNYMLSGTMAGVIQSHIGDAAPGHKVIVLDRDTELSVLTAAEVESPTTHTEKEIA